MTGLVNAVLFFWMVHFALSGLDHAALSASSPYIEALGRVGLDAGTAVALFQLAGFVKFAIAALFVLSLAMRLFGTLDERSEGARLGYWGATLAVLVLTLEQVVTFLSGSAGPVMAQIFAMFSALAITSGLIARIEGGWRETDGEGLAPGVRSPVDRAELAAVTAELVHLPRRKPAR